MKRMIIAVSLLLAAGMLTGCNKGKDEILPDGTKVFGERTLKDGTTIAKRVEFPDGEKKFDDTQLPDGTEKAARVEYTNGEKDFDVTWLPDDTKSVARATYPDGTEKRNIVIPLFATEQNDAAGFDGIPWGTPEYNGDDPDKRFHFENGDCDSYEKDLARVVGPPVDWPSANDLGFSDAVSASGVGQPYAFYAPKLPQGVNLRMKDERICYGFVDSKFAFAFSYAGQEAYAATKDKYPLLKTVSAESWGDPPSQSLPPHLVRYTANGTGYLFRRGDTNTRIYVFGESLMYIPEGYLLAIRERWNNEYKKAKAAAAEQQRQYEEQRRQEVNKAVQ